FWGLQRLKRQSHDSAGWLSHGGISCGFNRFKRTRMRTSDTLGTVVALRILIVLWMCVGRTRGQGLPTPDHDNDDFFSQGHGHQHQDHHRHLFFYNRLLPNGQEMKQYFLKNKPEKSVGSGRSVLYALPTPEPAPSSDPAACRFTNGFNGNCPLQTQPVGISFQTETTQTFGAKWSRWGSDPFLERTLSIQRNKGAPVPLGNWSGETRMTYTDERARAGMYVLEITSTQSDSNVFVLATLSPVRAAVYPALPPDPHVKVKAVSRGAVTFGWPDAGPENPGRNLEYCISVSRGRKFGTHCSLIAHAKGDEKPKFTKDDFWGFTGEKERAREFRRKAKPVKAMPSRKIFHQCVGSRKEFTFTKARRGKTYYIGVFVKDEKTNTASAYKGAVVKMPGKGKRGKKKSSVQILDGERKMLKLRKDTVPQRVLYEAKQRMALLSFELGVCAGRIPFEVYHNNTLIHQSVARRWKRIRMKNVLPGQYAIKFLRLKRRKSYVSVYATTKPSILTLPHNMSIKVFDSLTTCSNVTVAWMGTHRKQKYCLYYKEASQIRSLKRHRCTQMDARPKSERVMCTRYRNRDVSKAVMSKTITKLKPDTQYVLDVYLSKRHSGPVAYKTVKNVDLYCSRSRSSTRPTYRCRSYGPDKKTTFTAVDQDPRADVDPLSPVEGVPFVAGQADQNKTQQLTWVLHPNQEGNNYQRTTASYEQAGKNNRINFTTVSQVDALLPILARAIHTKSFVLSLYDCFGLYDRGWVQFIPVVRALTSPSS
ncbi:hypothetical protein BaRGS_00039377, partial [Batillaria attramentaria]